MRLKKTKKTPAAAKTARATNSSRSRNTARPRGAAALWRAIGTGPIVAAAACIVTFAGAIALVPTRDASRDPAANGVAAGTPTEAPVAVKTPAKSEPRGEKKPAAPKPAGADPVKTGPVEPVGALVADAAPKTTGEPIATASAEKVASVTITGCLEHDEQAFWLKDTSGDDAPTARSWKSGFLKKRSARIELVDPHNSLKLPAYVGRRIAATGTLVNREMQPHSLHPLGASCS